VARWLAAFSVSSDSHCCSATIEANRLWVAGVQSRIDPHTHKETGTTKGTKEEGKEEAMAIRRDRSGFDSAADDHPLPETLADAERLAASIEQAVLRETGGGVKGLRVKVGRGGVRLEGHCDSYYCKQLAQHAAMGVSGDDRLTNQIEVS
jgi:osmotically-inducible protein OsmY